MTVLPGGSPHNAVSPVRPAGLKAALVDVSPPILSREGSHGPPEQPVDECISSLIKGMGVNKF